MDTARVRSLAREILALPDAERQELAREILPALLGTRAGLEEIDEALRQLSDDDLRALVERARLRASDLAEDEIAGHHRRGRPRGSCSRSSLTRRSS